MEELTHLCLIELCGVVGRVKQINIKDKIKTNFTVACEQIVNKDDGEAVVSVTWFECNTFDEVNIDKGDMIKLRGRLIARSFKNQENDVIIIPSVDVFEIKYIKKYKDK